MGEDCLRELGFEYQVVGELETESENDLLVSESDSNRQVFEKTGPEDTQRIAVQLCNAGVDLLLFAGGDGTARDVQTAVGDRCLCLGIPAGVKMHSAVFAVTPHAAYEVLNALVNGDLVGVDHRAEVRDIDEDAFRRGVVKSKYYGDLRVPQLGQFVQQVKVGGRECEQLLMCDFAAYIHEEYLSMEKLVVFGSGGTMSQLAAECGFDATLLGIDAYIGNDHIGCDLDEPALFDLVSMHSQAVLFISVIGGQGHVLGRGNQQLSPRVVRQIGLENMKVVCSKTKLKALNGRPLLVDTGDRSLDNELSGYRQILTGYDDYVVYPILAL